MRLGISRTRGIFEKSLRRRGAFSENWIWVTLGCAPGCEGFRSFGPCRPAARACAAAAAQARPEPLLDVDLAAGGLDLLLQLLGLVLGDALLDGLGGALHEILRLLEAEARDRADLLDHLDLLVAGRDQDDVELRLLLDDRCGARARPRHGRDGHRRGGGD